MVLKKQTVTHNGTLSKGKTGIAVGSRIPPHVVIDHGLAAKDIHSSQRTATSARSPSLYEGQVFQMLADMKEWMKEQARSDCERNQVALDRENVAHEHGAQKQLND